MFFIYGGSFTSGVHVKHSAHRLGDVEDIVHVAINYRVGPLGKCFFKVKEIAHQ